MNKKPVKVTGSETFLEVLLLHLPLGIAIPSFYAASVIYVFMPPVLRPSLTEKWT